MRYVLDTNVLLHYVRNKATRHFLDAEFDPFGPTNQVLVSVVSIGEMYSLANKLKWGDLKRQALLSLQERLAIVEIRYGNLVKAYSDIESYSVGTHPTRSKPGSAVKMGKNDLWIAATTVIAKATVITSDGDFDHLNGEFLDVLKYEAVK